VNNKHGTYQKKEQYTEHYYSLVQFLDRFAGIRGGLSSTTVIQFFHGNHLPPLAHTILDTYCSYLRANKLADLYRSYRCTTSRCFVNRQQLLVMPFVVLTWPNHRRRLAEAIGENSKAKVTPPVSSFGTRTKRTGDK